MEFIAITFEIISRKQRRLGTSDFEDERMFFHQIKDNDDEKSRIPIKAKSGIFG